MLRLTSVFVLVSACEALTNCLLSNANAALSPSWSLYQMSSINGQDLTYNNCVPDRTRNQMVCTVYLPHDSQNITIGSYFADLGAKISIGPKDCYGYEFVLARFDTSTTNVSVLSTTWYSSYSSFGHQLVVDEGDGSAYIAAMPMRALKILANGTVAWDVGGNVTQINDLWVSNVAFAPGVVVVAGQCEGIQPLWGGASVNCTKGQRDIYFAGLDPNTGAVMWTTVIGGVGMDTLGVMMIQNGLLYFLGDSNSLFTLPNGRNVGGPEPGFIAAFNLTSRVFSWGYGQSGGGISANGHRFADLKSGFGTKILVSGVSGGTNVFGKMVTNGNVNAYIAMLETDPNSPQYTKAQWVVTFVTNAGQGGPALSYAQLSVVMAQVTYSDIAALSVTTYNGGSPTTFPGVGSVTEPDNNYIFAIDVANGQVLWEDHYAQYSNLYHPPCGTAVQTAITALDDNSFVAFGAMQGIVNTWGFDPNAINPSNPFANFMVRFGTCCCGCDDGFHFTGTCVPNVCTCSNGTGTTGIDCVPAGTEDCSACDPGFRPSAAPGPGKQICNLTVCSCAGGVPTTGVGCAAPGVQDCESCGSGFSLDSPAGAGNQSCVPNVCTCNNGTGATGSSCVVNASESCSSCNSGNHLSSAGVNNNKTCLPNVCTCTNGSPTSGVACATNGAQDCASCGAAHHLASGGPGIETCQPNACICPGGIPVISNNCIVHASTSCASCSPGFHLIGPAGNQSCLANVCTCSNGTGTTAVDCATDNGKDCSVCTAGFRMSAVAPGVGQQDCLSCPIDLLHDLLGNCTKGDLQGMFGTCGPSCKKISKLLISAFQAAPAADPVQYTQCAVDYVVAHQPVEYGNGGTKWTNGDMASLAGRLSQIVDCLSPATHASVGLGALVVMLGLM